MVVHDDEWYIRVVDDGIVHTHYEYNYKEVLKALMCDKRVKEVLQELVDTIHTEITYNEVVISGDGDNTAATDKK